MPQSWLLIKLPSPPLREFPPRGRAANADQVCWAIAFFEVLFYNSPHEQSPSQCTFMRQINILMNELAMWDEHCSTWRAHHDLPIWRFWQGPVPNADMIHVTDRIQTAPYQIQRSYSYISLFHIIREFLLISFFYVIILFIKYLFVFCYWTRWPGKEIIHNLCPIFQLLPSLKVNNYNIGLL